MFFRFRSANPSARRARLITWAFISVSLLVGTGAYFHFRSRAASTTVSDTPSFQADLKNTLDLQKGVGKPTFTRATTASVTDFEGIIRQAKANEARFEGARRVENLVSYSEDFSNAAWASASPSGSATASTISFTGSGNDYRQQISAAVLPVGRKIVFRVDLKSDSTKNVGLRLSSNSSALFSAALTTNWKTYTVSATVTVASNTVVVIDNRVALGGDGVASTIYARNAQLEDVTGQANQNPSEYVSTNVLTSAPYHGANVDGVKYFAYQNGNTVASNVVTEAQGAAIPDATLKGYLAEGQRTNLLTYSEDFSTNTATNDTTVTIDSSVSPNGWQNADLITEGSTGNATVAKAGSITASATVSCSIYAKKGNHDWVLLLCGNAPAANAFKVWFNLNTGTIGSSAVNGSGTYSSGSITSVGNGWYRLSITGTIDSSTTTAYQYTVSASSDGSTTRVSGGTRYLWGAQLEQASFASSYIPTTSATVTRNRDLLSYPSDGNMSGLKGSIYAEAITYTVVATQAVVTSVNNSYLGGIDLDLHYVSSYSLEGNVRGIDGSSQASVAVGAVSANSYAKTAFRWATNAAQVFLNGAKGSEDTSVVTPTSIKSTIDIGERPTGTIHFYGNIRNVKIWKKALTDTQLTNMTSATDAVSRGAVTKTTVNASQSAQMTQGLAGFWSFNGADMSGATALDRSGNNRSGTLANGPARTVGKVGQALHFDGTNDYAGVSSGLGSPNTLSISLWFRTRGSNAPILGQSDVSPATAATSYAPPLSVTSSGFLRGEFWTGSVAGITSSTAVNDGAWHHAVLIGNANTQSLYLDNTLVGSRSGTISQAWWAYTTMGAAYDDGTRFASGTGWKYFSGDIDEVRVYGRALSSDEVRQLYNLGR